MTYKTFVRFVSFLNISVLEVVQKAVNIAHHIIVYVVLQGFYINADSGCLGRIFRRRTYIATIVVGELLRSFDPAVSEWSNPSNFIVGDS